MDPLPLPKELSLEELGLRFPLVGLEGVADQVLRSVIQSWAAFERKAEERNALVLVAGGASGIGKTRFGPALLELLFAAAQRHPGTPPALVSALREGATRQLVLQCAIGTCPNTAELADDLVNAYFYPPITASAPRFPNLRGLPSVNNMSSAFNLITRCELAWRDAAGPIACVIHLDEVQRLTAGSTGMSEGHAGILLGKFISDIAKAKAVWRERRLFPIFYVSGLSKTLVLRTASSAEPVPVSLPLLTALDYTVVLRKLFGFTETVNLPPALRRALRCIEGPPRLLLLFLWALQTTGLADGSSPTDETELKIFNDPVRLLDIAASLHALDWQKSAAVLHRCLNALSHGRLVTFTANIKNRSGSLELFHRIASLVLLDEPVALEASLDRHCTVNQAVANGLALANSAGCAADRCRLHWPRIYIWALHKVRPVRP
jgi:hypothetical protein